MGMYMHIRTHVRVLIENERDIKSTRHGMQPIRIRVDYVAGPRSSDLEIFSSSRIMHPGAKSITCIQISLSGNFLESHLVG